MQATEQIARQFANASNVRKVWGDIIINVKEYGAIGDGIADDTDAIQQAVNYAKTVGKKEIFVPSGKYRYGVIEGADDIIFIGDGVTLNGTTPLDLTNFDTIQGQLFFSQLNIQFMSQVAKDMQFNQTAKTMVICMQGDSLIAGNGASAGGDIPNRVKNYLNISLARPNQSFEMINRGVGGDTAKMSNERWTTPSGADLFILMLGTNDYNKNSSMEEFATNYEAIIKREIANGTAVVLITPPQWGSKDWLTKPTNGSLTDYVSVVIELGKKYNCPVLDLFQETRNLDSSAYKVGEDVPHIHLSDIGYQLVGQKIAAFIGFQHPDTIRKLNNGSFLGVRPGVDGIKVPGAFYFIDEKEYYPTPSETTPGLGTGIKAEGDEIVFYYGVYANEDNLCLVPSFNFTNDDGTELFELRVNNWNMPILPNNTYMYSSEIDRNLLNSRLVLDMSSFPEKVSEHITQSIFKDSTYVYYRVMPTKGWYTLQIRIKHCEFHGFDILNKMTLDRLVKFRDTGWIPLTLKNGATNAGGVQSAYRVETRGSIRQVFLRLNLKDNGENIFATMPNGLYRTDSVIRLPATDGTNPTVVVIGTTGNMVTSPATTGTLMCEGSYIL